MATSYNSKIITNGLVLCLDAANPKSYPGSGTTWSDLSGNGNNGILTNGPTYNSGNGGSLMFDGVNDYGTIIGSSSLNIGGLNLTISATIKTSSLANASHGAGIFSKYSGSNDGLYEILLINISSVNYVYFRMLSVGIYSPAIIPIQLNQVYNISCVYENGTMRNYINGIEESSGSFKNINITQNVSGNIIIGMRSGNFSSMFTGNFYNGLIYDRALSASEIQQNFNATRSRYGI